MDDVSNDMLFLSDLHSTRKFWKCAICDPSASVWNQKRRFDQSDFSSVNWNLCVPKIISE